MYYCDAMRRMSASPSFFIILAAFFLVLFGAATVRAATPSFCPFSWNSNLKAGSSGPDVLRLQQFLNADADTAIALSGVGSLGAETTTFGSLTKSAVIRFQNKYSAEILVPNGLSSGTGIVGASTRAKLNALCATEIAAAPSTPASNMPQVAAVATSVSAPATVTDQLTVADQGQSESSLLPANATPLVLEFTLSAGERDVVVKTVTIERAGFGVNGAFGSFGLWDEQGLQIGPIATLNSLHRATFGKSFTIPAGSSKTFSVYANMQADETSYDGQRPLIRLVDISASSPVVGELPIEGPMHTVNASLVVGGGDAALSSYDPGTAITRYINDTNVRFAGIRITAHSQESLTLSNIIWTQSGSVGGNDITNIRSVVDGKEYPAVVSPYSEKEYVTFFEPGVVIPKGETKDVYVEGDILPGAANRTIEFDIRDINDEVSLTGNLYQISVWLAAKGNTDVAGSHSAFITSDGTTDGTALFPFFAGPIVTVRGGTINYVGKI